MAFDLLIAVLQWSVACLTRKISSNLDGVFSLLFSSAAESAVHLALCAHRGLIIATCEAE